MVKRKNNEQVPNNWHHSIKEERLEDWNIINVENLDIYNEIVGLEFSSRETSSSWYNGVYAD